MQKKEERRRRLHESLLNVLYPPPPSPPHQGKDEEKTVNILRDCFNTDEIGESGSSSSSDDDSECGPQKSTRAQRKRLRKKKLKEGASRRRKIIGPLLPASEDDDGLGDLRDEAQSVRCNVAEKSDTGNGKPGEPAACTNQKKLKHRRMAKKLARERSIPSITEDCHQDCGPCSSNNKSLDPES
ncbi:uncharacterized protein LOC130777361 isoform X2 [Actinidia eriantha]|uniref:uncharacterized protein LOC130777361 isoform X2 n=1 Tax=Actinidia eriantha TaxID=165200 RepID=UPI00258F7B95|nr:uncharacterized protein LOC130777361 isoform X2 [Actinidia eriantha]